MFISKTLISGVCVQSEVGFYGDTIRPQISWDMKMHLLVFLFSTEQILNFL